MGWKITNLTHGCWEFNKHATSTEVGALRLTSSYKRVTSTEVIALPLELDTTLSES